MNRHWKLQHSSKLAHNVCTEFIRSGGTSAAKPLKIPGPTTCASSFGTALLNALELPSLYAFSCQLARYETGVKVPLSEKWQTACDWSASVNGSELSLKQTFVGEECGQNAFCTGLRRTKHLKTKESFSFNVNDTNKYPSIMFLLSIKINSTQVKGMLATGMMT